MGLSKDDISIQQAIWENNSALATRIENDINRLTSKPYITLYLKNGNDKELIKIKPNSSLIFMEGIIPRKDGYSNDGSI